MKQYLEAMCMLPDSIKFKQLSFIKYLFSIGFEQAERPEPMCYAALLTFHDSVELFLNLSAQHLDAPIKNNQNFIDYWTIISDKLPVGTILSQKTAMIRLNKARVSFKHHGISPNKAEIGDFQIMTKLFFEENTNSIFGIDFSSISLIDIIQCVDAKVDLKTAEKSLQEGKIDESLEKIAFSFAKLFRDYKIKVKERYGHDPFAFSSPYVGINAISDESSELGEEISVFSSDVERAIDGLESSLSELQDAVEIIGLGIDFRKYTKFDLLKPRIKKVSTWFDPGKSKEKMWTYKIIKNDCGSKGEPTSQDVQFCIDFIIECAIILQEFNIKEGS